MTPLRTLCTVRLCALDTHDLSIGHGTDALANISTVILVDQAIPAARQRISALLCDLLQRWAAYSDNTGLVNKSLEHPVTGGSAPECISHLGCAHNRSANRHPSSNCSAEHTDPRIAEMASLIDAHLRDTLSAESLAHAVGLSASHFRHVFREHYGMSLTAFVNRRRLDRAALLLRSSHERVSAIAWDVGFRDVPHFGRSFSSRFGVSPTRYRALSTTLSGVKPSARLQQEIATANK